MERLVNFTLLGQEFSFYTDAPEHEVELIINMVQDEMENGLRLKGANFPSHKMLVLGCLRMAGRCVSIEKRCHRQQQDQENSLSQLIKKLTEQSD